MKKELMTFSVSGKKIQPLVMIYFCKRRFNCRMIAFCIAVLLGLLSVMPAGIQAADIGKYGSYHEKFPEIRYPMIQHLLMM